MLDSVRISLRVLNAAQLAAVAAAALVLAWLGVSLLAKPGPDQQQRVAKAAQAFADGVEADLRRSVADARGVALAVQPEAADLSDSARSALLQKWVQLNPRYRDAALIDADGTVRAAGDPRRLGADAARQIRLAKARNARTLFVTGEGETGPFLDVLVAREAGEGYDWIQLRTGPAFLAEAAEQVGRALGLSETVSFSVTGPDGRVIAGSAPAAGEERPSVSLPLRGSRDLASPGWLVRASATAAAPPAQRPLPPPGLLLLGLAIVLAAAGTGYVVGDRAARPLRRLAEDPDEVETPPESTIHEIAALEGSLVHRARSANGRLVHASTGRDRLKGRLRTFETMSGWACWEIDVENGRVTWPGHEDGAAEAPADRVTDLAALAARFDPADRGLLDLALATARDSERPHDVALRTCPDETQAGRRILIRFQRDPDAVGLIHALSREIREGDAPDSPAGLNERRRSLVLRRVTDGIVHDFNDVLTVVLVNLGILRRRPGLAAGEAHLVDAALQGAQRGAALTRRMLNLVRGDTETLAVCDVGATVTSALAFTKANVLRDVPLINRVPDDLPKAHCPERILEIVLLNVAFHLRDLGLYGFAIGAAFHESEEETGFGMAPGRYLRLLLASGRRMPGLLPAPARARSIETTARLLDEIGAGWRLVSDGTGEDGFLAEIWLKAADEPAVAPAEESPPLRILLVESDGLVRASLAEALAELGHAVVQAGSGQHALEILDAAADYDAIIVDQALPVMTGLQLAATVVERYPAIRVVMAAPHGQLPEVARRFLRLDKPFRQSDLVAVLNAAAPQARAA